MTYKKTASLFALSLLTACGTDPTGTTTASTTSALVGDQNNQGNDEHHGDDDYGDHGDHDDIKHVLLISVDGMHQSDLDRYVENHRDSTLAKLVHSGSEYTNAATSNPSDSDPGGTALMTGGNPKSTGVFYDVEYSHKVDEAGAACTPGQPPPVVTSSMTRRMTRWRASPTSSTPRTAASRRSTRTVRSANGVLDTNPAAIMNLKFDPKMSLSNT